MQGHLTRWTAVLLGVFLFVYLVAGIYTDLRLVKSGLISSIPIPDFQIYQEALTRALSGGDAYLIRDVGRAFLYPPPALLVVELFSRLPRPLFQAAVYLTANLALLLGIIYGIARRYKVVDKAWLWVILGLGFAPLLELLHFGQINLITGAGIAAMFLAEGSAPLLAGLSLGVAVVTKATPALFLGYLLVTRRFKVIAAALASVLGLGLLGLLRYGAATLRAYPSVFADLTRAFPLGPNPQSLVAKLAIPTRPEFHNFLSHLPANLQPGLMAAASLFYAHLRATQRALLIYLMLILIVSGLITWFTREREPLFIIANLAMMLSPNVMWYHHYVFILLPLMVWMGWRQFSKPVVAWCLAGLLLIQVDRWHLTYGLLIHAFGHASILLLLMGQLRQLRSNRLHNVVNPAP